MMLSATKMALPLPSNLHNAFISLFPHMVLERSSSRKLNGSGKSGHPCLVPGAQGSGPYFTSQFYSANPLLSN